MRQTPDSNNSNLHKGTKGIEVNLWQAPDALEAAQTIASFYQSTWGDPIRPESIDPFDAFQVAELVASGKGLPNCLETANLTFSIAGISRTTTHQLVRTRVGAGFGQQGGRDNNWSEFNFRIPESWFLFLEEAERWKLLDTIGELSDHYTKMVELGVPFQDARYVLPMGLETTLVGTYNLLSLKGTLNRRLCNRMAWEINWVARLMADLTVEALPWVGRSLRSGCEQRGVCASVSPMFPPSCVSNDGDMASDNNILTAGQDGYDWSLLANGNAAHISTDKKRLEAERQDPNIVVSLADGETVLAVKKNGVWMNA